MPLARRNRSGGPPATLVSPRVDRSFLSCGIIDSSIPSKGPTAEVGQDTRHRSDPRRIQKFRGRAPSKSDQDRLDKGFQDLGLGVFLGTFCTSKKYPGVWGRVGPIKRSGARSPWKAESRSQPASGVTGSHPAAFPPARRRAHQPFGGRGGPIKGARGRIAPGSTAYSVAYRDRERVGS